LSVCYINVVVIRLIASATQERMQMRSGAEVRRELKGSVAIAIQRGKALIILEEYRRAVCAALAAAEA
jgi:hypothetical protein